MLLPFLLSAAIVGAVVVFFLPFIQNLISQSPMLAQWTSNRAVQVVMVGAIVVIGIGIFVSIARSLKIPVKVG